MIDTLVVIGHHKEEALFGDLLRKFMEKDKDQRILFYSVTNSYNGNGRCTKEEIFTAHKEVYDAMQLHKPNITIDVHTGDGASAWWSAELFTLWDYKKMICLEKAETAIFPVQEGKIYVPKNYPEAKKFPLIKQRKFPYVVLEKYLVKGKETPPFTEQISFTAEIINDISIMYRRFKSVQ